MASHVPVSGLAEHEQPHCEQYRKPSQRIEAHGHERWLDHAYELLVLSLALDRYSRRGSTGALVGNKADKRLPSCSGLRFAARYSARRRINATSRGWSSTPLRPCQSRAPTGNC